MRDWRQYVRDHLPASELKPGSGESVVEELANQLEDLCREALDRGFSESEAEQSALDHVGDWDSLGEYIATDRTLAVSSAERLVERTEQRALARGGAWAGLADVQRDVRFSLRTLRKSPGFTIVALATLALGIAAVTTIFSLIDSVLLRPLPYADSGDLVYMWEKLASFDNASVAYPNFLDWRERNRVYEDIAAYNDGSINLTGIGDPIELDVVRVSASMFHILGIPPRVGRSFLPDEDRVGGERVVILTHGFWRDHMGGDPAIVGRTLTLDDNPYTVVGVMPSDCVFPPSGQAVDVYVPIEQFAENWMENRSSHPGIMVVGRLAEGIQLEQARGDMERVALELEVEYPDANEGSRVNVASLHVRMTRTLRQPILLLLLAVGLLLLIACANVANLVLARSTARQREIAIRTSLGADSRRVIRLLLTESMTLWTVGGLLGMAIAVGATRVLGTLGAGIISPIFDITVDLRVVGASMAVALLTGVVFGLMPAFRSIRSELLEFLKEGSRASGGVGRNRVRSALVVAEVSLAVGLLVAAGLTVRSLAKMITTSPGLDPQNVLSIEINLPTGSYTEGDQRTAFFFEVLERVRALPGVAAAATAYVVPVGPGGWQNAYHVEGEPPEEGAVYTFAEVSAVSDNYFGTMGIPRQSGRDFTRDDRSDAPPVVIVDEVMAERYWPGSNPIGKRLKFGDYSSENSWMDIVGVVGHVKVNGVVREALPQLYIPHAQDNDRGYYLMVKTAGDPNQLVEPIRREVLAVDPLQPIAEASTMTEYLRDSTADSRLLALLLAIFAGAALLLAAVGIYGVMAQATAERVHEIGIRVALGATGGDVLGLVVRQGMARVALGVALGLALAVAIGRMMASGLFGVSALDPLVFIATPAFLSLVALGATLVPARRAMLVDPVTALRE